MPRASRKKSSTNVYHVILRGNNKQDIFFDEKDYKKIEINLCFRIYKSVLKCMRWKWLRNRYGKKIKDIMIDTIWGRIK